MVAVNEKAEAIVLQNLTKIYGEKKVVDNISLSIPKGLVFGLLGPNGAGKSTIINIISGITRQTSGEVFILGKNMATNMNECKMQIGTAIQEVILDPFFSVIDYLTFVAGYYGISGKKAKERIEEICENLNLTQHLQKNTRMLSGGMKRRLVIAKALLHDPEIIILDEPTAGVDLELRTNLWDYMLRLNKQGKTIILTTHYLEEAETFCDNLAFINNGKIVLKDKKKNVLKQINSKKIGFLLEREVELSETINASIIKTISEQGILLEITYNPLNFDLNSFLVKLNNSGAQIKDIITTEPNLDDIFLSIFKKYD